MLSKKSSTPKTDKEILGCFSRSKTLVKIWTVFFVILAIVGIFAYLYYKQEFTQKGIVGSLVTAISLLSGSYVSGIGYNIINILGLNTTCNCLKTCGDGKTIKFIEMIKRIKLILIIDTLAPFLKPITTPLFFKYHYTLKNMVEELKRGEKGSVDSGPFKITPDV